MAEKEGFWSCHNCPECGMFSEWEPMPDVCPGCDAPLGTANMFTTLVIAAPQVEDHE